MIPRLQLTHEIARERAERAAAVLAADPRVRLVFQHYLDKYSGMARERRAELEQGSGA